MATLNPLGKVAGQFFLDNSEIAVIMGPVGSGKTVVAVNLDNLIRTGGLLDQLKAQGLEVIGPAY